ncbi:restriction endonuclease subunit S [Flavobacterium sp.]|uniref:restriction endonuclease subunit S n=1 Tax=Flavobacterium sp. TaxID=239 RepID=UPI002C89B0DF|nr:restriction endonuclease subunit S [Flavobacterium sp.]HSD07647.1 restriction endonuclease subunit S [Flavobacterium sp.]
MSTAILDIEKKKTLVPKLRFKEFGGEWNKIKLGEAFTIFNGYAFASKSSVDEGVLWVKIADVGIQEMKSNNLSYLPISLKEKHKKFILKKGDFVVALTRPILNGKLKIAEINRFFDGALLNQRVGKIISKNSHYFIYSLLQKTDLIKSIENNIAGSDPPNLSPNEINSIEISIPTLPEQQKIASFLSAVDEKIQQLSRKKELLEQYKKGVMQQMFSGKLRFKDENGEDYPDWEEKKLGELVTLMQSGISRMLSDTDIGLPIIRSNNLQNGRIDVTDIKYWFKIDNQGANLENYVLSEGDLLVNFINSIAQIGKVAMFSDLMKRKTIFTTNLLRLRFNEKVTSHFMINYFHLKQYEDFIQSITKPAVNQASFTTKDFRTFIVNLPSLPEQQKIANFLSSIDVKIESTNQQITKTQSFKKGLLQQMFV